MDTLDDDVNVTDHSSYTPLHDAAEEGVVQAVQLLLKHGAKADVKNKVCNNIITTVHERNACACVWALYIIMFKYDNI